MADTKKLSTRKEGGKENRDFDKRNTSTRVVNSSSLQNSTVERKRSATLTEPEKPKNLKESGAPMQRTNSTGVTKDTKKAISQEKEKEKQDVQKHDKDKLEKSPDEKDSTGDEATSKTSTEKTHREERDAGDDGENRPREKKDDKDNGVITPPEPTKDTNEKGKEKDSKEEEPKDKQKVDSAGDASPRSNRPLNSAREEGKPPFTKIVVGSVTWILGKKLGEGSFGEIYQGINSDDEKDISAIKLGKGEGREMLIREAKILYSLRGYEGVPEIKGCCAYQEFYVMVMELLGPSLSDLLNEYELSLKVILLLADQMIKHLQYIHSKNTLHGDLKPSNFLMGRVDKRNMCLLIDFGLCEEYRNPETKKHIPYSDKHGFHGTPRYCSIHVHNGIVSSRRDDMESLGYVMIYLLQGKLPWQNLPAEENETKKQKRRKIAEMKTNIPVEELCKGLPEEFITYINITRNLKFKEKPDYYALRMLFRNLFVRNEYGSFDDDWRPTLQKKRKKRRKPKRLEDEPNDPKKALAIKDDPRRNQTPPNALPNSQDKDPADVLDKKPVHNEKKE